MKNSEQHRIYLGNDPEDSRNPVLNNLQGGTKEATEHDETEKVDSNDSLRLGQVTLDDIKVALQEAPKASRFVLKQRADNNLILVAEDADMSEPEVVASENMKAIEAFKEILQRYCPEIDFKRELSDLCPISPIVSLREIPPLSAEVIYLVLEKIAKAKKSSSFDRNKYKTWQEALDAQDFTTTRDGAVFWTGYSQGNLTRAISHAQDTGKKALEMTQGGEWLVELSLHDPTSVYDKAEVNQIWRQASQKFAEGVVQANSVSNHVVAFILDRIDPNTIYHGTERDILLANPAIFLSEVVLRPGPSSEDQLKTDHAPICNALSNCFDRARELWRKISTSSKFDKNTASFLAFTDIRDGKIAQQMIAKFEPIKNAPFFENMKSLYEVWERLCHVVHKLHMNQVEKAQIEQQSKVHNSIDHAKGIETINETWNEHYRWLEEAIHLVDYQIFKKYREHEQNEFAAMWREKCLRVKEERKKNNILDAPYTGPTPLRHAISFISDIQDKMNGLGATKEITRHLSKRKLEQLLERRQQEAWKSIWSPGSQRVYKTYSLPEDIPGVTSFEKGHKEKAAVAPERYEEELEEEGKTLFAVACSNASRVNDLHESITQDFLVRNETFQETFPSSLKPTNSTNTNATILSEEEIQDAIKRESHNLNDLNQQRWEARRRANEWTKRAKEVSDRFEELKKKTEISDNTEEQDNDLAPTEQSTVIEKMTSVFSRWHPKFSVTGSKKASTQGDKTVTSTISSQPAVILDIPDYPTARDVDQFNHYADRAEQDWEMLVRQTSYPDKVDLWFQSDQKGIKYWEEQKNEVKREEAARHRQGSWEAETKRWRKQKEANRLRFLAEQLEKEVSDLNQEKETVVCTIANKRKKRLNFRIQGKPIIEIEEELKKLETKDKELDDRLQEMELSVREAQEMATKAYHDWLSLAEKDKTLKNCPNSAAKTEAEHDLYESDEVTNRLWTAVKKRYQDKNQTNLIELELIEKAEEEEEEEQKEAERAKNEFEENLKSLPIDKYYLQAMKREALRAAREHIPGAQEILLGCCLQYANTENRLAIEGSHKALLYFQDEVKRLMDIETLWIGIVESKNRTLLLEQAEAAKAYYEGDRSLWNDLPLEAKEHYNNAIDQRNKEIEQDRADRRKLAQDLTIQAQKEVERIQRRAWRSPSTRLETALKRLEEKKRESLLLELQEKETKRAIVWAKLHYDINDWKNILEDARAKAWNKGSEDTWRDAKATATYILEYWNMMMIEKTQQASNNNAAVLNQEEIKKHSDECTRQVSLTAANEMKIDCCMSKSRQVKKDKANAIIALIKEEIWPLVSSAMKDFTEHPSEVTLFSVYESAATAAEMQAAAHVAVANYGYASTFLYPYSYACAYSLVYAAATVYRSFVIATIVCLSNTASEAAEASEAAVVAAAAAIKAAASAKRWKAAAGGLGIDTIDENNMDWFIQILEEVAKFVERVATFRAEQEASTASPLGFEWEQPLQLANAAFAQARDAKTEISWNNANKAAMEAFAACNKKLSEKAEEGKNLQERTIEEVKKQADYWQIKTYIARIKLLVLDGDLNNRKEKANAIMKMIKEQVWPFISQAKGNFREFPTKASIPTMRELLIAIITATTIASDVAYDSATTTAYAAVYAAAAACGFVFTAVTSIYTVMVVSDGVRIVQANEAAKNSLKMAEENAKWAKLKRGVSDSLRESINWSIEVAKIAQDFTGSIAEISKKDPKRRKEVLRYE